MLAEVREELLCLDWRGQTVVCIASGPSAKDADLGLLDGRARVIVVNESWRLYPRADVLYACDPAWWRCTELGHGPPRTKAFAGRRVTQDLGAARQFGLERVHLTRGADRVLTGEAGVLGWGGNGGFHVLNIAVQSGARRIVLVGYDMSIAHGLHWHGRHPAGLNNPREGPLRRWATILDAQAPRLAALGVTVLNASLVSALTAYPRVTLREALEGGNGH